MTKTIHKTITLVLITILYYLLSYYLNWQHKWYLFLILFFISRYISNFFFMYFYGINILKLEFLESENTVLQEFTCEYLLGFSEKKYIKGEFNNKLNLNKEDIRHIIYSQTNRKDLRESIIFGNSTKKDYKYRDNYFSIEFY
jgi:hypothetical protein